MNLVSDSHRLVPLDWARFNFDESMSGDRKCCRNSSRRWRHWFASVLHLSKKYEPSKRRRADGITVLACLPHSMHHWVLGETSQAAILVPLQVQPVSQCRWGWRSWWFLSSWCWCFSSWWFSSWCCWARLRRFWGHHVSGSDTQVLWLRHSTGVVFNEWMDCITNRSSKTRCLSHWKILCLKLFSSVIESFCCSVWALRGLMDLCVSWCPSVVYRGLMNLCVFWWPIHRLTAEGAELGDLLTSYKLINVS